MKIPGEVTLISTLISKESKVPSLSMSTPLSKMLPRRFATAGWAFTWNTFTQKIEVEEIRRIISKAGMIFLLKLIIRISETVDVIDITIYALRRIATELS